MDQFTALMAKLEHLEQPRQLHQIYEWTKTGFIDLSEFKGLVGRVMTPEKYVNARSPFNPNHLIRDVECIEIRKADGAQCLVSRHPDTPLHLRTVWLLGMDRYPTLNVGDRGRLEYTRAGGRSYHKFIKENGSRM